MCWREMSVPVLSRAVVVVAVVVGLVSEMCRVVEIYRE